MRNLLFILLLGPCLLAGAQHTIEVKHTFYTMQYDTVQCAELLGYYVQTLDHYNQSLKTKIDRATVAKFKPDPLIDSKYQPANDKEYTSWNKAHPDKKRDRGHVNPYSAFDFDLVAAKESMYFTNTCPQVSFFNEHQWEQVEMYVLKTICPSYGDVKVWTGVLISDKKMNDVPEPDYYWKVIQYTKDGQLVEEAWLGHNDETNKSTKPADIVCKVSDLKAYILSYYPKLEILF